MKERTAITIDKDLLDMIKQDESLNFSGLVNRLLRNYYAGDMDIETSAKKARIEILENERDQIRNRVKEIDSAIKILKSEVEKSEVKESAVESDLGRFVGELGGIKKLTSMNYVHFREAHGLSREEVDEKLKEMSQARRGR